MAKRFTDTQKWEKHFIRGLKAPYKLLWYYICDKCDHAGIWDVDIDLAKFQIGEKSIKIETAQEVFKNKIIVLDGGLKWFIPSFIEFQYGQLSETNRAHTKIILILKKFNLLDDFLKVKPLESPLQGAKDMDMEEEKDKEMEKEKGAPQKNEIAIPFETESFLNMWGQWKAYKEREFKFKYKSEQSEQAALNELAKLADGIEQRAIDIILQSIANGWKGFFELKNEKNVTNTGNTAASSNGTVRRQGATISEMQSYKRN